MHTLQNGYRGLSLLVDLNWDLILYLTTLLGALMIGAYVGGL